MPFADIVGHERCVHTLSRALSSGRVPHAYLFSGPDSVGKATAAVAFAQTANCCSPLGSGTATDACGTCASCRKAALGIHPDVMVVRPLLKIQEEDVAVDSYFEGTMIRTEQVGALVARANMTVTEGRRKVFVVEHAEAMNDASANRLLKTLEEPPGATTFILTTPATVRVLPTIRSRCQPLRFGAVPDGAATEALTAAFPDVPGPRVQAAVALAGGRYGWARRALSQAGVLDLRDELLALAASLSAREPIEGLPLAEDLLDQAERWWLVSQEGEGGAELLKRHRDRALRATVGRLLDLLLVWFRDIVALHRGAGADTIVNRDHREALAEAEAGYSPRAAQAACRLLRDTKRYVQQGNANLRLALEVLLIGLIEGASTPTARGANG